MLAQRGLARQASGRGLVLLPAGALVVHQLRYTLTYGSQATNQLADQGHAYLGSLVPWIVLLAAAGLGGFVSRLAHAWHSGGAQPRALPLFRLWATTGAGLVAIYSLQELLEGLLAQGHPGGLTGIYGHGGWWAIPAAAAVALVTVLLLRVAHTLVRLAARPRVSLRRKLHVATRPVSVVRTPGRPLANSAAGRAPPGLVCAG
jgi:hypothetical protein